MTELILKLKDYPAKFEDYCPELKEKVQFSKDYGSKLKDSPIPNEYNSSFARTMIIPNTTSTTN
ncbi:hypothetical protein AS034_07635 [[Bacillus] enclensis]|nr:hypothetical protein AS034_07635 [[Bacillus] enclensis]